MRVWLEETERGTRNVRGDEKRQDSQERLACFFLFFFYSSIFSEWVLCSTATVW